MKPVLQTRHMDQTSALWLVDTDSETFLACYWSSNTSQHLKPVSFVETLLTVSYKLTAKRGCGLAMCRQPPLFLLQSLREQKHTQELKHTQAEHSQNTVSAQ